MDEHVVSLLACPRCHGGLTLTVERSDRDGSVEHGQLTCSGCSAHYPIIDGIADFSVRQLPFTAAQLVNRLPVSAWAYERFWRHDALGLLSGGRFRAADEPAMIVRLSDLSTAGPVVDIACGNGYYARALRAALDASGSTAPVIGIDHSRPMVVEARRRARAAGLSITYLQASAQQLPLRTASISRIVMGGSWNEIGNERELVAEWRRVCRDDSRVVLMYLQRGDGAGRILQGLLTPGGLTFPTHEQVEHSLRDGGFDVVETHGFGIVTFSVFERAISAETPPKTQKHQRK